MIKALVIVISILVSTTALAVNTRGSRSCGVWIQERQQRNETESINSQAWLVGYLSGLAVALGKDFLRGTDNESLFFWTDNYCRANPLEQLHGAGEQLAIELIRKKTQ